MHHNLFGQCYLCPIYIYNRPCKVYSYGLYQTRRNNLKVYLKVKELVWIGTIVYELVHMML